MRNSAGIFYPCGARLGFRMTKTHLRHRRPIFAVMRRWRWPVWLTRKRRGMRQRRTRKSEAVIAVVAQRALCFFERAEANARQRSALLTRADEVIE